MRCNEFDSLIDEMLAGILHPEAAMHMRECERCNSHYRARAAVQSSLHSLAAAAANAGPSPAVDRAVMEAFRRRQQRPQEAATARVLSFPVTQSSGGWWSSRTLLSGAAAAAILLAVAGAGLRLWKVESAGAPIARVEQRIEQKIEQKIEQRLEPGKSAAEVATITSPKARTHSNSTLPTIRAVRNAAAAVAGDLRQEVTAQPVVASARAPRERRQIVFGDGENYDSGPMRESGSGSGVMRLASNGAVTGAQTASSTWPGYSNLMYCDPVTCAGPMQVVRIKVPVGEVNPNLGQTVSNGFVNADVVVGPDGVARAIRVR